MDLLIGILILSIFIGSIAVVAGLGGGVLLVPIIVIMYAFQFQVIISSVIISLIIPALIGTYGAYRRNEVDFKLGLLFGIPSALGAFFGARTSSSINEEVLKYIFSAIALLLSIKIIQEVLKEENEEVEKTFLYKLGHLKPTIGLRHDDNIYRVSLSVLLIGGLILGFISGMFGVGGGWIKVPLLILAFRVKPEVATGTSLFMVILTSIIGGATHLFYGNLDVNLTYSLIIGLGIGAFIGNAIKSKIDTKHISLIIAICLIIVSVLMLL